MSKVDKFKGVCKDLAKLYEVKNKRYGDSFSNTFEEHGLLVSCVRLEDKLSRLKALYNDIFLDDQKEESIEDTLKDLANYAIMTLIELEDKTDER